MFSGALCIRFAIEVAVVIFVIHMVFHRLLGYFVGKYLTGLLGTPEGAFQFEFRWIALRLGLDQNELVVTDFVWKNPPRFEETPCFVKVHHLLLRFDLWSVIEAIRFDKSIKVNYLELSDVDVYIEKGKKHEGLNLWAALGGDNAEDEKHVESSVLKSIAKAVRATAGASSNVMEAVVKYNPASLIYRKVNSFKSGNSSSDLNKKDSVENHPDSHDHHHHHHHHHRESIVGEEEDTERESIVDGRLSYVEEDDHEHEQTSFDEAGRDTRSISAADSEAPSTPHSQSASDGGERTTSTDGARKSSNPENKDNHWGVPYTLETDLITIRNVFLFAQDFLNAEHSSASTSRSHAIKISLANMTRKELTDRPKKKGKHRRGVYLDDLVWRIIAKVINELIAHNKIAMTTILASAAANQTSAAVIGSVTNIAKGVTTEIYNYNPKTFITGATSLTNKAIGAISHEKMVRSDMLTHLDVRKLRVRLISARKLRFHGKPIATCFCSLNLEQQANSSHTIVKSSARRMNVEEDIVQWNESFDLTVWTLDAVLIIKIYESKVFGKDTSFVRLILPLSEGTGKREESVVGYDSGVDCKADNGVAVVTKSILVDKSKKGEAKKTSGKVTIAPEPVVTAVHSVETQATIASVKTQTPPSSPRASTSGGVVVGSNGNKAVVATATSTVITNNVSIGIKSEIITWHALVPMSPDFDQTSGEIQVGLSLIA